MSAQTRAYYAIVTRVVTAVMASASLSLPAMAQSTIPITDGPGPGPRALDEVGCSVFPAPASTGTKVGLSYFGPPPDTYNPSLVGPEQLLNSGQIDAIKGTITLPLYEGFITGSNVAVWYILTDVSDLGQSQQLGLNYSAKLEYAAVGARTAHFGPDNVLYFDAGTVDFSPHHVLVAGSPKPFPPSTVSQPGSVGDQNYSPYVVITNSQGIVYNAPVIAFGNTAAEINAPKGNVDYSKVHDEVVAVNTTVPGAYTVTIQLINGFSFGRPVWYMSMDSSDPTVAAIEHATYAPLMKNLPLGGDDSFNSPIERIFIADNGEEHCKSPRRQGLYATLTDGFRPNNTLGGIPTLALDYSPAWDITLYDWTPLSVSRGYRQQLREEFQILTMAQDGLITGFGGAPFGSFGVVNNCPIALRLD